MKRALEAVVIAAALGLAAFIGRAWLARRAARPGAPVASYPGADVEDPRAPAAPVGPLRRGVTRLPMVHMTVPPNRLRTESAPPPPPPATR